MRSVSPPGAFVETLEMSLFPRDCHMPLLLGLWRQGLELSLDVGGGHLSWGACLLPLSSLSLPALPGPHIWAGAAEIPVGQVGPQGS